MVKVIAHRRHLIRNELDNRVQARMGVPPLGGDKPEWNLVPLRVEDAKILDLQVVERGLVTSQFTAGVG